MLDPKLLRKNAIAVAASLKKRHFNLDQEAFQFLEAKRRVLQNETQALQVQRNQVAKAVAQAKSKREDSIDALMKKASGLSNALKQKENELMKLQKDILDFQLMIPNLLDESVPSGRSESDNLEITRWGELKTFDFECKDHVKLGESLGQMDFKTAAKLSGSRFVVLYGPLAKLQRALAEFMLDLHIMEYGYQEVYVPYLVHTESLYGTGQLPKFKEDQFQVAGEWDLNLIPTAEVPMTNLVRGSIIEEKQLPLKYVSQTPCFRSEAGSYGKEVRGMLRQHQFQKVEIVQLLQPEYSDEAHETMLAQCEEVLRLLELPYRVTLLCSGDTGFSSAKTYDLEVWMPAQRAYYEVSSISHYKDFQARRMKARYRSNDGSLILLHTLNGSGLAVGRTLVAIMENYQDKKGRIHIPSVLKPYMKGMEFIA